MSYRIAAFISVILCFPVTLLALHAPERAKVEVQIIDQHGNAFPVYHAGLEQTGKTRRAYLEAINGSNYAIRVRNRTGQRVGLVIAVDGRNIISGSKSSLTRHERMYILGPWETASYEGWRASSSRINQFYFTEAEDSYAGAFKDHSAMGVIAVAVFEEKHRPRPEPRYSAPGKSKGNAMPGEREAVADSAEAGRILKKESRQAGTGYGEEKYSHARLVHFSPKRSATEKLFLKYEWRSSLCQLGVLNCLQREPNRFWPEKLSQRGFAPPPPGR